MDGGGESHLAGGAEVLRERNHELLRGDILHGAGSVRHVANAILCVQASPKEGDGIGLVRGQVLSFHCAARFFGFQSLETFLGLTKRTVSRCDIYCILDFGITTFACDSK